MSEWSISARPGRDNYGESCWFGIVWQGNRIRHASAAESDWLSAMRVADLARTHIREQDATVARTLEYARAHRPAWIIRADGEVGDDDEYAPSHTKWQRDRETEHQFYVIAGRED